MGSPIVFQTAPPQPASNARMICSPQLVGGADASQNGLGQGIPQNVVARVGLSSGKVSLQPRGYSDARAFSIRHSVDNFPAAIGAVAAREELGVRSLTGGAVDHDPPTLQLQFL